MTEDQIERTVEREMNRLDREYTRGMLDEDQYDREVKALDVWARDQYRQMKVKNRY